MRKNINSASLGFMLLLCACGTKEKPVVVKPEQVVAEATSIICIGKILPKAGIISLSANFSGNIDKVHVKAGDSVKKGDLVLQLGSKEEELAASESQAQIATQQARNAADAYEVSLAEIKLRELSKKYQTSKELSEKGAETEEVLNSDYTAYLQQQQKVEQAIKLVKANRRILNEFIHRQHISTLKLDERQIKSPADGVILNMDARQGQTLQPNLVFADLAPAGELVAECEVDELYAGKIRKGQRVLIYPTSSSNPVAEGVISFVGASLQDKSILYEKIGEGADRRVRRMTVAIIKSERSLLINDKVECKILLN